MAENKRKQLTVLVLLAPKIPSPIHTRLIFFFKSTARKKKNNSQLLILAKLVAAGHLAVALKGLALLAIKALFISKIALVLAGVIAIKGLLSGGHQSHKYEVITADHHEGGHDRVYAAPEGYSQDLAYRGYPNKQQ